jgi:subtilisin family serine protease
VRNLNSTALLLALSLTGAALAAPRYDTNTVIVTFRDRPSHAALAARAESQGARVVRRFQALEGKTGRGIALLDARGRSVEELVFRLRKLPFVASADLNYYREAAGGLPDDSKFSDQWALVNTGQTVNGFTGTSGADIRWLEAKALAPPTGDVVVAVIDSGVAYNHPDLAGMMWTNPGEVAANGIDDDTNGFVDDVYGYDFAGNTNGAPPDSDPMDDFTSHGTFCSGIIAAQRNNAQGIAGVSRARIMALKVGEGGTEFPESDIIAATDYAVLMKDRGVNIVALNESFGGAGFLQAEQDAVGAAGAAGIIVSAAAGNASLNVDTNLFYPVSFTNNNLIGVAATDAQDGLASFSNFGTNAVDLGAPGARIISTVPPNQSTSAQLFTTMTNYSANPLTLSGLTTGITTTLIDCGLGYATSTPAAVSGNVALIQRGDLFFYEKVANAMASGAVAAIIYNNVSGNFGGTLLNPTNWIPTVSLSLEEGQELLTHVPTSITIVVTASTNAFNISDGTSFAAPQVSGAVALMALAFPNDSVTQRIARILSAVEVIPALTNRVKTGGRLDLAAMLDTDADQLGDWWELIYTNTLAGMDGAGDPDGDGISNAGEFAAGSDPTIGNDFFRMTSNTGLVLQWTSEPGKEYRVHAASSLTDTWISVNGLLPATPPQNAATVTINNAAGVFRIEVE